VKICIMTDMEGVAGVLDHDNWCQPRERNYPGRYYDLGREFLTMEVNAAVAGFVEGGADSILVVDGHGAGGINPALLDQRAQLMRGWPEGWPDGLDASFDAVAFVGQHAKAGTPRAHLAHTQWFNYLDQTINGLSIGEFGELAVCAAELAVPVIFASGDEALCREAMSLTPGIVTVAVKRGTTPDDGHNLDTAAYMAHNLSAIHLHPEVARRAIRSLALAAIHKLQEERAVFTWPQLVPPYERVTLLRPDADHPTARIDRAVHPTSLIAALNLPFDPKPL
jgi:D-amino peptidase